MRWLLPLLAILAFATGMAIVSRNPAIVLNTESQPPSPGDREWRRAEQAKPKENEKAAKSDQIATEAPPSVIQPFNRPDSATNPRANGAGGLKESPPDWRSPEWSIVWATLGLVLVTGVQVVMFLVQLRYMRVGMNDAKIAAEAARSAAEATGEANRISAAQFAVAERPWVSVTVTAASDLAIMPDNRYLFVVRTTLKNHGRSAAFNIRGQVVIIKEEKNIQRTLNEIEDVLSAREGRSFVGNILFPTEDRQRTEQINGWHFSEGARWGQWKEDATLHGGFIIACFTYKFAFDRQGQTRVAYMLAKDSPSRTVIFDVGGGIEASDDIIPRDKVILHPFISSAT